MPRKKSETTKVEKVYLAVLDCSNKKYESSGETIAEAIGGITENPNLIKGYSTITVSKGNKKHSIQLSPIRLRRFLINRNFRLILAKQLNSILK